MAQYSQYADMFTATTDRYPSAAIWEKLDALSEMPGRTVGLFDDFETFPVTWGTTQGNWGRYKTFGSSGAAGTDGDAVGGVLVMTEATDNEGMALATTGLPFQLINSGGTLGFEARVKFSTVNDTGLGVCIGLASTATYAVGIPMTTSGILYNTLDFVGFERLEADGDKMDTVCQETGIATVVIQADAISLAADTWVKVGFLFEPQKKLITFFQNGVPCTTTKTVSDTASDLFPNNVRMGMCYGQIAGTTTPGAVSLDWWKCYQAI